MGTFQTTKTVPLGAQHLDSLGIPVDFALLVADRKAVEVEPVRLREKARLDRLVLVEEGQMVPDDRAEGGASVLRKNLMARHERQLDLGVAIGQGVEGVVVVHSALARVPTAGSLSGRPGG